MDLEQLIKLHALKEQGVLTESEYELQKQKKGILKRMPLILQIVIYFRGLSSCLFLPTRQQPTR